ncbi:MAG: zinc-ribbon domain-containing protein [Lachnospiraceae bacterium]|nr:zinc-ribbon domain-containing protein [Lachnospiraceae bacterium]
MICTNCGAHLMDSDLFCPKCGTKTIKDNRCPDCGALLRDGTKFCHKCGCPVSGAGQEDVVSDKTLDIPIDAIERNILSETAAEVSAQKRPAAQSASPGKKTSAPAASKKKESVSAPPQKKKVHYRKEEDWEEDDWEEDDWDDEEESVDIITIMTAIVGCVLLVVVAILGYHMYQRYVPKNYDDAAQESEDGETDIQGQELEGQESWEEISEPYVTVIKNVNVRDNPSTTDSNVLKVAQAGENYLYGGSTEDGEWIEIILDDDSVGYVFHEYVTVND